MFPNRHAIYLHDTPAQALFSRSSRAFSAGCIRVKDPLLFAELLLQQENGWDRERILFELHLRLTTPSDELVRGAGGIAEGIPADRAPAGAALPKFRPGGLMLAYAGGGAGLFSALIGGWVNGDIGSKPVAREVRY